MKWAGGGAHHQLQLQAARSELQEAGAARQIGTRADPERAKKTCPGFACRPVAAAAKRRRQAAPDRRRPPAAGPPPAVRACSTGSQDMGPCP